MEKKIFLLLIAFVSAVLSSPLTDLYKATTTLSRRDKGNHKSDYDEVDVSAVEHDELDDELPTPIFARRNRYYGYGSALTGPKPRSRWASIHDDDDEKPHSWSKPQSFGLDLSSIIPGLHINVPEHIDGPPSCHSIVDPQYHMFSDICGVMPQARYSLPNLFGHVEKWQIAHSLATILGPSMSSQLNDPACARSIKLLVCPLLFPPCKPKREVLSILPCKSFCRGVKAQCPSPTLEHIPCEFLAPTSDFCPVNPLPYSSLLASFGSPLSLTGGAPLPPPMPPTPFPGFMNQAPLPSPIPSPSFLSQSSFSSPLSQSSFSSPLSQSSFFNQGPLNPSLTTSQFFGQPSPSSPMPSSLFAQQSLSSPFSSTLFGQSSLSSPLSSSLFGQSSLSSPLSSSLFAQSPFSSPMSSSMYSQSQLSSPLTSSYFGQSPYASPVAAPLPPSTTQNPTLPQPAPVSQFALPQPTSNNVQAPEISSQPVTSALQSAGIYSSPTIQPQYPQHHQHLMPPKQQPLQQHQQQPLQQHQQQPLQQHQQQPLQQNQQQQTLPMKPMETPKPGTNNVSPVFNDLPQFIPINDSRKPTAHIFPAQRAS